MISMAYTFLLAYRFFIWEAFGEYTHTFPDIRGLTNRHKLQFQGNVAAASWG
jgi:hypothetical protein